MKVPTDSPLPLRQAVKPTMFLEAPRIGKPLEINLTLANETFQYTGSFKFRAAYNVASTVPQRHLITASSGNFGQALAYACFILGKNCIVVMPTTSAQVKIDAVKEYGGIVEFVDTQIKPRNERLKELAEEFQDAYIASPYDDPLVIEGNSTLGEEVCSFNVPFDTVVVPIGGGGLSSGIITGILRKERKIRPR
jgi:threonine dehydratase